MYDQAPGNGSGYVLKNERPFFVKFGDNIIDGLRGTLTKGMFDTCAYFFAWAGYISIYITALLIFGLLVVTAAKVGSGTPVVLGFGVLITAQLVQYMAAKLMAANEALVDTSPSKLSSLVITDCLALCLVIISVCLFVMAIVATFSEAVQNLNSLKFGTIASVSYLAYSAGSLFAATLSLNPDALNVEVGPKTTFGEEAIGNAYLLLKLVVKFSPIWFGIINVTGSVMCFVLIIQGASAQDIFVGFSLGSKVKETILLVGFGALMPIIVYAFSLLFSIFIELYKAIIGLQWLTQR